MGPSPRALQASVWAASVLLLLVLRLPFLGAGIDDLDSANFHAGIARYSPPEHRPHPPGFPVFIGLGKVTAFFTGSPSSALHLMSAVAGSLACIPLFVIVRRLFGSSRALAACAFTCFAPMVWFMGVRPMSDTVGLLAGLTALALLLEGLDAQAPRADRLWRLGAVAAGLAVGVRLQLSVLVLPLFVFGWIARRRLPVQSLVAFSGTVCAWLLPMVWLSGGAAAYWTAFRRTMLEAASWEPLISRPSAARAIEGLQDVAIGPWMAWPLALPVLALAAAGVVWAWKKERAALGLLLTMFLPYAAFSYLIQNTTSVRYVIPAVPLFATLAAVGFSVWRLGGRRVVGAVLVGYVIAASTVTLPALLEYRAQDTPAVQALRAISAGRSEPAIVSGSGVFARYMPFGPRAARVISANDGFGWRRVTDYWRRGETSSVYFLYVTGEPFRNLVPPDAYREVGEWRWAPHVMPFMRGERPNAVRVARLEPPAWFLYRQLSEPGTRRENLGLFVRGDQGGHDVLIQGRSDWPDEQTISLRVDGTVRDRRRSNNTFLVQARVADVKRYSELSLDAKGAVTLTRVRVARPNEAVFQPIRGVERDAGNGELHWLGTSAAVMAHVPAQGARLRIIGRAPDAGRSPGTTLEVFWNQATAASLRLSEPAFDVTVALASAPDAWSELRLETKGDAAPGRALQVSSMSLEAERPGAAALQTSRPQSEPKQDPLELARR